MPKALPVVALGLLALRASAPSPSPVIVSAYLGAKGGVVFDSPITLSWDSLVPAELRRAALDADLARRQRLFDQREEMYGMTEVTFPHPLPSALRGRSYYLLDSTGVYETRPTGLLGTVRINWNDSTARIRDVQVYGSIEAPARAGGEGGFVLITESPVTLRVEPSQLTADALLAPRGGTYTGRGMPFREIVRQYVVRQTAPSPDRWVWVQWRPDSAMVEIGCTLRFALFHWQAEPEQVASTDYGCDV